MKGPREYRRYVALYKKSLKAIHWDDLFVIMKVPNCKKWRKCLRRPRDGYGIRKEEWE